MTPKISIITITYNCENTLEETLQSVIAQSYPLLEYIVIDGGSTDGTLAIIDRYSEHIQHFVSEPDRGISDAFNKGIAFATGDIIGILNADDIMLPQVLHSVALHYDGRHDVYRGNTIIWNDKTQLKVQEIPSMHFPLIPINIRCSHQGTFITPAAYRSFGLYNTEIPHCMDLELLRRFCYKGAKMKYMDVDVALYRMGGYTETPMTEKRTEYKKVVLLNGGNLLQANLYYAYLRMIDILKKILTFFFGEDFKRRLRYRKFNHKKHGA